MMVLPHRPERATATNTHCQVYRYSPCLIRRQAVRKPLPQLLSSVPRYSTGDFYRCGQLRTCEEYSHLQPGG
jgi:hypothetical protein